MKKTFLRNTILVLMLIASIATQAQNYPIPDQDMEDWELIEIQTLPPLPSITYEQPESGWWTTLNPLKNLLNGPETVKKTTDSHSGTYAAELTTKSFGTLPVSGLLVTGIFNEDNFDINNPDPIISGQPFTDLPTNFKGWYKYSPANGDSCHISSYLFKFNTTTNERDTIAEALMISTATVSSYTEFDLTFDYWMQGETPDSIIITFLSSAGAQDFIGQDGSRLWIDDFVVEGTYVSIDELQNDVVNIYPNPADEVLNVELKSGMNATISIFNMVGQQVMQRTVTGTRQSIDVSGLLPGVYSYRLETAKGERSSGRIQIN